MAVLELKGYGVASGTTRLAGIDLSVEPGTMLVVVGRGDAAVPLLALALARLLPKGATTEGTLTFAGKHVLYIDREADASAVVADAELIVADEPGRGRDPATQLALLLALQQASRTAAVLFFTADFRLALNMGLEVAVIANGRLLLKAPASQIFELPQYDTVRHLVGGQRLRTRTLMRPPIGEPVLELDGVARSFRRGLPRLGPPPVEALKGVGFSVRQGEVVGLLGVGGAGKSTLLRLIAGLDSPSAGHIGRRQGLIGYVFSDPRKAFNPTLPVGVSLTEPLRVEQTLLVEEQADRLVEVVRAVGLEPELLTRLPGEFGIADLQRMALARALVGRPNLLLLDDPTAVLDPAETREFLVLFARVRADFGLTAVIASREFEVMRAVTDRLLVLEAGHIVEGGKPGEVLEAPKQEITRRLVSGRYPGPAKLEPVVVAAIVEQATAPVPPPEDIAALESQTVVLPAPEPVTPEPEPEPVHNLSPTIVIAPVVLAEPVIELTGTPPTVAEAAPKSGTPEPTSEPFPAVEVEPVPTPAAVETAPVPRPMTVPVVPEPRPEPAIEPEQMTVPVEDAVLPEAAAEPQTTAEPVVAPAEATVMPEPEPAAEPEPAPADPAVAPVPEPQSATEPEPAPGDAPAVPEAAAEPQPAAEPVAPEPLPAAAQPSADTADEAAEGGEAEGAVDRPVDAAGGPGAVDGEAGRERD